eukprot:7945491-Pyramimonas_sp.AAC.1
MTPDEEAAFHRAEMAGWGPRVRLRLRNNTRILRTLAFCFLVRSPSLLEWSMRSCPRCCHRGMRARQKVKGGHVKGPIERGKVQSSTRGELGLFDTFEDFGLRRIGLKRCEDEEGAKSSRPHALSDPEKPKVNRVRGQWLLGR